MNNTWGTLEGTKNSTTPFDLDMIQRAIEVSLHKELKDCSILDYGSGEGRILSALIDHDLASPNNVYGRDISPEIVERCKKEHPNFADRVEVMDHTKTGIPGDSIDFAMLMGVGVCNPSRSDFSKVLYEIFRTLKAKGVLYVTDFLETPSMQDTYEKYRNEHPGCERYVYENKDGMKFVHRSLTDFMLLLLNAGFIPIESNLVTITSINGHKYNGIKMTLFKF